MDRQKQITLIKLFGKHDVEPRRGISPLLIEYEPAEIIISGKLDPREAYQKMLKGAG